MPGSATMGGSVWRPPKTLGVIVGAVILATIIGIEALLLHEMSRQQPGIGLYLTGVLFIASVPLLGLWLYWFYELIGLHYRIDRNALYISHRTSTQVIPLGDITRVVLGNETHITEDLRGVGWPGYIKGRLQIDGIGEVLVHSTEPLDRQVIVATSAASYGISPHDVAGFLENLDELQQLGPVRILQQKREYAPLIALPVWHDKRVWLAVSLGLVANAALFGLVLGRYAALPLRLPLHFDVSGHADRIASREWVLVVPTIGTLALVANTLMAIVLHYRERLAAYLLAAAGLGIQALVWMAGLSILG